MNAPLPSSLAVSILFAAAVAPMAGAQVNEDFRLLATDATAGDTYGYALDIDGANAVVGARGDDDLGSTSGSAYVVDPVTGAELRKLTALDGELGDVFGVSVAIDGAHVLVGARGEDGNEDGVTFITSSGSAYLFDAATGQQLFKLRAQDPLTNALFGQAVALSGDTAVIGSRGRNTAGLASGTAYVFDVSSGLQTMKLLASDGAEDDSFGDAVAIDGGLVVAGAWRDDDNGTDSGSAYVFDAMTGAEITKLLPTDGAERDFFGVAVAISGNRVVVGARRDDDNGTDAGSAYVFDATTGAQLAKLTPLDGAANDNFGERVAISDSLVAVSSAQDDDSGNRSGAVYVFDLATGQQLAKLLASDGADDHFLGLGLAISGEAVMAGSPFSSASGASSGSAYVFDLDGIADPVSYCAPQAANSVSNSGALLTSVSGFGTAQATFDLTGVPNSFGLLFAGTTAADVVLGCGNRCVGGGLVRGQVVMGSGNQVLGVPFDMATPGVTHIQYWYRDIGTCGAGFDLSNALTR